MSKLIGWYVVELRLRLEGKLSAERVETVTKEAESHLTESSNRYQALNIDEESAEKAAIQAFGRPEQIAISHLRKVKHRMLGLRPMWIALVGAILAITAWNFHWMTLAMYFDNFGETWQSELAGVVGVFGLGLIFVAARRAYRSHRLAIAGVTILAALMSIPVVSYWMVGTLGGPFYQGVSRFHMSRDVPQLEKTVALLDAYKTFVSGGIAAYQGARSESDLPPDLSFADLAARELGEEAFPTDVLGMRSDKGGNFVVPRRYGVFAEVDGRVWVLSTMAKFSDAKREWAQEGPQSLAGVIQQRSAMASLLASAKEAQGGRLFFFNPALYNMTVLATFALLPGLWLVDLIGVLLPRAPRRWPGRAVA